MQFAGVSCFVFRTGGRDGGRAEFRLAVGISAGKFTGVTSHIRFPCDQMYKCHSWLDQPCRARTASFKIDVSKLTTHQLDIAAVEFADMVTKKKGDEAVAAYLAEPYISAQAEVRRPSGWHFTCTGFLGGRSADWFAPGWTAR